MGLTIRCCISFLIVYENSHCSAFIASMFSNMQPRIGKNEISVSDRKLRGNANILILNVIDTELYLILPRLLQRSNECRAFEVQNHANHM